MYMYMVFHIYIYIHIFILIQIKLQKTEKQYVYIYTYIYFPIGCAVLLSAQCVPRGELEVRVVRLQILRQSIHNIQYPYQKGSLAIHPKKGHHRGIGRAM